jgi:hypothetical protein
MLDLDAIFNPDPDVRVEDLDPDWRVEWEERAAIMEFDGGQPRERAEAAALREIVERMRRRERFAPSRAGPACRAGNDACVQPK